MAEHRSGRRRGAAAWWFAALVLVPAALAAVSLAWPGPQISAGLKSRAQDALVGARLGSVAVSVSGRDVRLDAVPLGSERAAAAVVSALDGVGFVQVGEVIAAEPAPAGTAPTAALPSSPAPPDALDAPAREQLRSRIAAVLAAAPITFPADSAALAGPAADSATQVARLLVAEPAAEVAVDGYVADSPGSAEIAQRLSVQRATAVTDLLVAAGVARARITATGRGDTHPLPTPAASRRVEISIP